MVNTDDGSLVKHALILVAHLGVIGCVARRSGSSWHLLLGVRLDVCCLDREVLNATAHIARLGSYDRAACIVGRKMVHL